jgi:hypothetical protein
MTQNSFVNCSANRIRKRDEEGGDEAGRIRGSAGALALPET